MEEGLRRDAWAMVREAGYEGSLLMMPALEDPSSDLLVVKLNDWLQISFFGRTNYCAYGLIKCTTNVVSPSLN